LRRGLRRGLRLRIGKRLLVCAGRSRLLRQTRSDFIAPILAKRRSLLVRAAGHRSGALVADCIAHPTSLYPSQTPTPVTHLDSVSLRCDRMSQDYMERLGDEAVVVVEVVGEHQIVPRDGVEVQAAAIRAARSRVGWNRTW
jgi:hypothetical protein